MDSICGSTRSKFFAKVFQVGVEFLLKRDRLLFKFHARPDRVRSTTAFGHVDDNIDFLDHLVFVMYRLSKSIWVFKLNNASVISKILYVIGPQCTTIMYRKRDHHRRRGTKGKEQKDRKDKKEVGRQKSEEYCAILYPYLFLEAAPTGKRAGQGAHRHSRASCPLGGRRQAGKFQAAKGRVRA